MEKRGNRYEYLTKTPVPKLICALAVPTIISMLVTGIYNAADTYFVGKISTPATAAVGLVFSVMAIIQALGFFSGHGSGNYISRMLGAGNSREADEMAATGFALAILIGVVLAVLGNVFLEPLAMWLGATPTTLQDTKDYMRIILIGAPFMTGQFVINNQLRFQGGAVYAMAGLLCGAVLNLFLDPLLILGFHMGVTGAAIATITGQIVSMGVLFFASRRGENIRLKISNIRFNSHYLKEIVNGGSPSLFRQGLAAVSAILLNTAAGRLGGDAAIAGMSIVTRIMMLLSSVLIGFGQGYQPVCSFNYGAGLTGRVKGGYFFCLKFSTVFLTGVGIACFFLAEPLVAAFRDDPAVIKIGIRALHFQALSAPFLGANVITNMMLQSIGKGVQASISASLRNGICFIPLILILPMVMGLTGVEITQAIADVLSCGISIPLAASELRKM